MTGPYPPPPEGYTLTDAPPAVAPGGFPPPPEGFAVDPTFAQAATQEAPPPPRPSAAGSLFQDFTNSLAAGAQHTSPVVRSLQGEQHYQSADQAAQAFYDEAGFPQNAQTQVVLRDPDTHKMRVYLRNPAMAEEGPGGVNWTGLGRTLGFGTLASPVTPAPYATTGPRSLLLDFQRAQVPPSVPAVSDSLFSKLAQKTVGTIPFVGGPVQKRADDMVGATAGGVDRIAGDLGTAGSPKDVGVSVDRSIEGFTRGDALPPMPPDQVIALPTRSTSFAQKSDALYGRFDNLVPNTTSVDLTGTLNAMGAPVGRFPTSPDLGALLTNPTLRRWADAIQNAGGSLTMQEVRELRGTVGRMLGPDSRTVDIPQSDLRAVYAALSNDMRTTAEAAGPEALQAFTRADKYYSAGLDRIGQIDSLVKGHPEGTFAAINAAAGSGSKGDIGKLTALRRSLDPDEWGDVAATLTQRLGAPTPGNVNRLSENGQFSVSSFLTNAEKLSPESRDLMWGAKGTALRDEMESLLNVAQSQKNVDKFANFSNSAEQAKVLGLGTAAYNAPIATAIGLVGGNIAARLMMWPRFVNLLYRTPTGTGATGAANFLAKLDAAVQASPDRKGDVEALYTAMHDAMGQGSAMGADDLGRPAGQPLGNDALPVTVGRPDPSAAWNSRAPWDASKGMMGQGGYPMQGPERSVGPLDLSAMFNSRAPWDPRRGLLGQGGYPSPLLRPR